jgi:hypothetical protein
MSNPEPQKITLTEEDSSSGAAVEKALRYEEDSNVQEILNWELHTNEDDPADVYNCYFCWTRPDDSNLPDKSKLKVDVFPDDDKAESAVRAALAGRACIYWGAAIIGKKRQVILLSRPGPAVPAGPQDALSRLLAKAKAEVGVLSTKGDPDTEDGRLGCADAVTKILNKLGFPIRPTPSTDKLDQELGGAGWHKIDVTTSGAVVPPGAVIVSPTRGAQHGHTGIVGENGLIYSNDSNTGLWKRNYTIATWLNKYKQLGLESHAFVPPADAAPAPVAPAVQAPPSGSDAPIGSIIDGVKITHYGYAGDSTPDTNSMKGIGDRDNRLQAGISVALTQSMRRKLFGRGGKSTGQTFQWPRGGRTYRDDDTAPQSDLRIDVYDPGYTGID